MLNYGKIFDGLKVSNDAKVASIMKKRKLTSMLNVIDNKKNSGQNSVGWRRLTNLRRALDSFKPFGKLQLSCPKL